jgi:hypothetical protein
VTTHSNVVESADVIHPQTTDKAESYSLAGTLDQYEVREISFAEAARLLRGTDWRLRLPGRRRRRLPGGHPAGR